MLSKQTQKGIIQYINYSFIFNNFENKNKTSDTLKMKKQLFITAIAFLCVGLSLNAQSKTPVYLDNNQPIELRVNDALSRMTLEEKVKLCTAQSKFSSHGVPRLGIPEMSALYGNAMAQSGNNIGSGLGYRI